MIDRDASLGQQLFNIAIGESVTEVPPHCQHNHLLREPEADESRSRREDRMNTASAAHALDHAEREADHGRLTARLRPMRGVTRLCSARVISAGHAFVQNLRRGQSELGLDIDQRPQLTVIFTELARGI